MAKRKATCDHDQAVGGPTLPPAALDRAARLLAAMGDSARLRILELLQQGELCVTEIVAAGHDKFPTVSQRLRLLRGEGLISRRRDGNHIYYAIADRHVADLIKNALDHARELEARQGRPFDEGDD